MPAAGPDGARAAPKGSSTSTGASLGLGVPSASCLPSPPTQDLEHGHLAHCPLLPSWLYMVSLPTPCTQGAVGTQNKPTVALGGRASRPPCLCEICTTWPQFSPSTKALSCPRCWHSGIRGMGYCSQDLQSMPETLGRIPRVFPTVDDAFGLQGLVRAQPDRSRPHRAAHTILQPCLPACSERGLSNSRSSRRALTCSKPSCKPHLFGGRLHLKKPHQMVCGNKRQ